MTSTTNSEVLHANRGDEPAPDVPIDLLIAHLEYAAWAAERTLAMLDRLPPDVLTRPVVSSFPTMLETLQHIYQWDQYYLVHLRGGRVALDTIVPPESYRELKDAWRKLHSELAHWANSHLSERKDVLLHGWATWPTWMIVMQIGNHASHHLGQMLTLIRQAGYAPVQSDWTDLILYYLQRFPVKRIAT
jgi:uncharacterized damage-inducible protein DinB